MDLEFHQLDLRYEGLRRRAPEREKRLLASLAEHGQQQPVVVVAEGAAFVLVDGCKRVRALKALRADTVRAMAWDLAQADALVLERLMRAGEGDDAFEQAWLLRELHERFGLSGEELARRFDRTGSWVSRRLSLVDELPGEVQEQVRAGRLGAHAAAKYLSPLARANRDECVRLTQALCAGGRATSRQVGELYAALVSGGEKARELVLRDPWLFLRAQKEAHRPDRDKPPAQQLLGDFGALAGMSRRVRRRLREGLWRQLSTAERDEVRRCAAQARADVQALFTTVDTEDSPMLDQVMRSAILRLHEQGRGKRAIAKALGVSRGAVREVLASGSEEVPASERDEKAAPHRDEILALLPSCKGNLVRVHEELATAGAQLSYQALTAYCRRHGLGHEPKTPAGRYDFAPGQEMQHDTSPHTVELAGRKVAAQTASLVLGYSHMLFVQVYPAFNRFLCKVFLTDALAYYGGACGRCMLDNSHVVVLRGTGARMEPVPEMAAFAERYGFVFAAHELGDANRSARVERNFDYIENNFLARRPARDWEDLNAQARAWCDKVNATARRHLHASPRELFAAELPSLKALPAWVPEVREIHHRIVDVEGYVNVHRHRYSAPYTLIGRQVEVHELKDAIEIFEGPRRVGSHRRIWDGGPDQCVTDGAHRPPRGQGRKAQAVPPEIAELVRAAPELGAYLDALRAKTPGRGTVAARRLLRLVHDYPRAPLAAAAQTALHYGLFDLDRLERLVLRGIAGEIFPQHATAAPEEESDE